MSVMSVVDSAFREQTRTEQNMSLSGAGHWHDRADPGCDTDEADPCLGERPLDRVARELSLARSMVASYKNHSHTWDENGFCGCGWDGNA